MVWGGGGARTILILKPFVVICIRFARLKLTSKVEFSFIARRVRTLQRSPNDRGER